MTRFCVLIVFDSLLKFLKFMNHKKSRLTDLFRKMDKNNDGLIPRDDFIDGIMKTSELKIYNIYSTHFR